MMRIDQWMQRDVVTAKPRDSILHARELMESRRVNQLPVVVGDRLVGIVTDRDLRDAFPSALGPDWPDAKLQAPAVDPADVVVEAVMTENAMTLAPEESLVQAAQLMRMQRIGAVPVTADGRLVGVLTRSDILEAFMHLVAAPDGAHKHSAPTVVAGARGGGPMASKQRDRVAAVVKDLESLAKRMRADLRRAARETGLTKNLQKAAGALRKQAATAAAQVEKYAHEVRVDLSKPAAKKRPAGTRATARRPARKRAKRRAA